MTNFDYLKNEDKFADIADAAVAAEKTYFISKDICAVSCRKAMETGIKWMCSVDEGFADYVLYDDAHIPLAVVEAKRTCKGVEVGRKQAALYAELLEKEYRKKTGGISYQRL